VVNVIQLMMPCLGIGLCVKRKGHDDLIEVEKAKRQAVEVVPLDISGSQLKDPEAVNLLQENKKLRLK